jgi:hypothetical protein
MDIFLVLVCGTRAQSLSATFSYILYNLYQKRGFHHIKHDFGHLEDWSMQLTYTVSASFVIVSANKYGSCYIEALCYKSLDSP